MTTPVLKARVAPVFPGTVLAGEGLLVSVANGVMTLSLNFATSSTTLPGSGQLSSAGNLGLGMAPGGNYRLELNKAHSHIHLSFDGADTGGYIASVTANNLAFSGGANYNGTNWIAKSASASVFVALNGTITFQNNTGLTVGSSFTPTVRMFVGSGVAVGSSNDPGAKAILTDPVAVASLPAASSTLKGSRMFVTDANATTFMSTVAGGGANNVPVVCDGTNWKIG
jgi:hypothetical protein